MEWTLVTGGSKRLGREICLELARRGMPILVHYRSNMADAQQVADACRSCGAPAEVIQGDFSTLESTSQFVADCRKRHPRIKNLINNVGNYMVKSAAMTAPEEWNQLFQTNLHAPFALCHGLLPGIVEGKGSIVNIGVVGVSNVHADVKRTAYTTAKMALWMLTKSLAREFAPSHVRVNMVSPGYIENAVDLPTPSTKLPMGRPASFAEVTKVVAFLMQEDNSYITGQNIEVGGGIGLVH